MKQEIKEKILKDVLKNINDLKTPETLEDWTENIFKLRPKIIEPAIDLAIEETIKAIKEGKLKV